MNKCLKIIFSAGDLPKDFLPSFIQKNAKKLNLEGTVQIVDRDKVKIVACGAKEAIDKFLDVLHKGSSTVHLEDIEVEPFIRDKDYRNVFRVIE